MKPARQTSPHMQPPLNPIPWIVWVFVLPIVAMEVVLGLAGRGLIGGPGGIGWRMQAMERFAFSPDLLRWMIETGNWGADNVLRFLSYGFVHGSFTHAVFAIVILLAMGKFVAEIFAPWAVAVVVLGSLGGAAVIYTALGLHQPLIGAYPGVYGLIGAFTFLIWVRLAGTGNTQYRAFTMIGFLMGVQILFALFSGGTDWVADLAGFGVGFGLSFVVSPGGWGHVMARLRRR